jgi:hypothetical protein
VDKACRRRRSGSSSRMPSTSTETHLSS